MKRTVTAVGATVGVVCTLLTTARADAQQQPDFAQRGQFIVSVDRLVPFFAFSHESQDEATPPGVTKVVAKESQSSLSILYSSTADTNDLFYTVPRVGFDYVVVPNVTIGGDLVVFFTLGASSGTETDSSNGTSMTTTTGIPKTTLFGIAPRGGYVIGVNNLLSIWLRGGFSYYTTSQKTAATDANGNTVSTTTVSDHQFSLDLDPQLVITPIPHLGFTAGITTDIPFGGGHSIENETTGSTAVTFSAGSSVFYLGVTLGMLGYF